MERAKILKPRHQRDIGRVINLIKIFALLNLWFRERNGSAIITNEADINDTFAFWDQISESQELGIPPYVYNLYHEVVIPAFQEKNSELEGGIKLGISQKELLNKHFKVYGRFLSDWQLRQQILPMLETAGLITQERDDPADKRKVLIYPTVLLTISPPQNNSESGGGVQADLPETPLQEPKPQSCSVCSGTSFWQRPDGGRVCSVCHPPIDPTEREKPNCSPVEF